MIMKSQSKEENRKCQQCGIQTKLFQNRFCQECLLPSIAQCVLFINQYREKPFTFTTQIQIGRSILRRSDVKRGAHNYN